MNINDNLGNESFPSIISNPFAKININRVSVSFSKYNDRWSAYGNVEFSNNNTNGEQKFKGETFDDVVIQIKAMIQQL
jgi:hypothetical protein